MANDNKDVYFLDSSNELDRLRINHHMFKRGAGGQLIFAPVDWVGGPKTVLDVAGADGYLVTDLEKTSLPHNAAPIQAVVTDIVADYVPKEKPSNIEFVKHDSNDAWPEDWSNRFDLVHQRLGFAALGGKSADVTKSFVRMTKPGGWIQLGEQIMTPPANAPVAWQEFLAVLRAIFAHMGQDPHFAETSLRKWVEDAGCIDIQERRVECHMGKAQSDPELRDASIESTRVAIAGVLGFAKTFDPTPETIKGIDLGTLDDRFVKEAREKGISLTMRYVWGRRPG